MAMRCSSQGDARPRRQYRCSAVHAWPRLPQSASCSPSTAAAGPQRADRSAAARRAEQHSTGIHSHARIWTADHSASVPPEHHRGKWLWRSGLMVKRGRTLSGAVVGNGPLDFTDGWLRTRLGR